MARTYKRKEGSRNYGRYSEDSTGSRLEKAIRQVKRGKLSIRKASEKYNIPRGTLHNKVRGVHTSQPGHPTVFSADEEQSLVTHIVTVSQWGFPFTTMDMRFLAKSYLDSVGRSVKCFKKNYPSIEWARSFLLRHKATLTQRNCQNIKGVRSNVSPDMINKYFDNLEKSLKNDDGTDIDPSCIFNYDETNLTDDPGVKKCVFHRGVKYPERIRDGTKASISIMFCGSAAGDVIPPYVVYKADHLWDRWTEGGLAGVRYNRTKSGWFDSVTFSDWFHRQFLPYSRRFGKRVVLIGDNLASHFSEEVIRSAAENDVAFVCLPRNSTHLCQPLDVGFFRPLKMKWRSILDNWKQNSTRKCATLSKDSFPGLLKELCLSLCTSTSMPADARNHASGCVSLKSTNLVAGFRKCGIFPLNRQQVLARLPNYETASEAAPTNIDSTDTGASKVNDGVSGAVMKMLKTMRYGSSEEQQTRKRRHRIDVQPGCSISYAEMTVETPNTSKQATNVKKNVKTGRNAARKNSNATVASTSLNAPTAAQASNLHDESTSDIEQHITEAESEQSDVEGTSTDSDTSNEDCVCTETALLTGNDAGLSAVNTPNMAMAQVDSYVAVQFEKCARKTGSSKYMFYIAKVVEIDSDNKEYEVSCLRKANSYNQFRFPDAEDRCNIDHDQIVKILPMPTATRRGFLEFNCDLKQMGVTFE